MKKVLLTSLFALFLLASGASAQEICTDCGITEENIEFWKVFDVSGDGGLSTLDLVIIARFQLFTGIECVNETMLSTIVEYQIDLNNDGVFDGRDWAIINAFSDYFWLTGNDSVTVEEFINCLRAVILGICP